MVRLGTRVAVGHSSLEDQVDAITRRLHALEVGFASLRAQSLEERIADVEAGLESFKINYLERRIAILEADDKSVPKHFQVHESPKDNLDIYKVSSRDLTQIEDDVLSAALSDTSSKFEEMEGQQLAPESTSEPPWAKQTASRMELPWNRKPSVLSKPSLPANDLLVHSEPPWGSSRHPSLLATSRSTDFNSTTFSSYGESMPPSECSYGSRELSEVGLASQASSFMRWQQTCSSIHAATGEDKHHEAASRRPGLELPAMWTPFAAQHSKRHCVDFLVPTDARQTPCHKATEGSLLMSF